MAEPKHHVGWPSQDNPREGYSTSNVCERLNLTPRQLNHLVEKGILSPGSGSGVYRRWSYNTVAKLTVAKHLFNALPPQLRREGHSAWTAIADVVMAGGVPRAGHVKVRRDGVVAYLGTARPTSLSGLTITWDGLLYVNDPE